MRLALDHPHRVTAASLLDCIPITEHLDRADSTFATRWWHWFFYAQPDLPERAIGADPRAWYRGDPDRMGFENHREWLIAINNPDVVRAMLEDYRAGLTVDTDHERADREQRRTLAMPVQVLWSMRDDLEYLYGDPLDIWRRWAPHVLGHGIESGHHMAEDAPTELAAAVVNPRLPTKRGHEVTATYSTVAEAAAVSVVGFMVEIVPRPSPCIGSGVDRSGAACRFLLRPRTAALFLADRTLVLVSVGSRGAEAA